MANKPTDLPEWASTDVTELKIIDGTPVNLLNKVEPPAEWKLSGELYQENLPRAYINFQFDLIHDWITHLDERYVAGDFHLGANADTAVAVSVRLGGTWVDRGTDTIAGQTVRLFEKTV